MDVEECWLEVVRKWRLHPDGPATASYWAPELETCSRDRLREIQEEKLAALVPFLYERSEFYREKLRKRRLEPADIRSVSDLHKVPVTTKRELAENARAHPPFGTVDTLDDGAWRARGWMVMSTSGTVGAPMLFRFTAHDRDQWAWNYGRALWAAGIRPGRGPIMIALPYTPHVYCWGVHHASNLLGIPIIAAAGLDTARRIHLINTLRPVIICSTPSYCNYLGQIMLEQSLNPADSSVEWLVVAGEPGGCVPATKHRLEKLWGAQTREVYGATEGSPAPGGYQCPVTSTQVPYSDHLAEDVQIWEVVDPETYLPVDEGALGITVVTNLYSHSTPLLRFVVGDHTRLSTARCGCGRTHVRAVGGFLGRADDMLTVGGLKVFPTAIEDLVRSFPELTTEFELEVAKGTRHDSLTLRVEVRSEVPESSHPELARRLAERVRVATEVKPEVVFVPAGTLERPMFKAKRTRFTEKE